MILVGPFPTQKILWFYVVEGNYLPLRPAPQHPKGSGRITQTRLHPNSLTAVRRLMWCGCAQEMRYSWALLACWQICRTHCPPLAVDGLWTWAEELAFPEHPSLWPWKITGTWYWLWFINSVRGADFVGDSNIPSRSSWQDLCEASALCEINCEKNSLGVILSLYARKWCKKPQKSARLILEHAMEDFHLVSLVNESFM